MDETFLAKAIILDQKPFRENEVKLYVYTKEMGKLELVARGAKKISSKLAGHIQPICEADIMVVRGRQYNYAGSALGKKYYHNLKKDYEKIIITERIFKIIMDSVEYEHKDREIYDLITDFLEAFDSPNSQAKSEVEYYFILKFLLILGYKPELYRCVKCQEKIISVKNMFDYTKGGLICEQCFSEQKTLTINENSLKILRLILEKNISRIISIKTDKETIKQTISIISSFYHYVK